MLPRVVFSQHDPVQVIVFVSEVTITPQSADQPGMEAINADGTVVNLPFTKEHARPIHAEFSIVPGVLHKQRIIAGGADLYLELPLASPVDDSVTARAKFFFHKQNEPVEAQDGQNLVQINDPFSNETTVVIPFNGSSVELGAHTQRFGEKPKQVVVSTHVALAVLPTRPGT
jgi:hypothetical protein